MSLSSVETWNFFLLLATWIVGIEVSRRQNRKIKENDLRTRRYRNFERLVAQPASSIASTINDLMAHLDGLERRGETKLSDDDFDSITRLFRQADDIDGLFLQFRDRKVDPWKRETTENLLESLDQNSPANVRDALSEYKSSLRDFERRCNIAIS